MLRRLVHVSAERRTTSAGVRASALLGPAVVAVVLGILGMHGLSTHGATAAHGVTGAVGATAATGTPPMDTIVDTAPAATADHPAAHAADHAADQAAGPADGQHDHGGAGSTVMLCVAMLAAATATLVTLLVRRSWPAPTLAALAPWARRSHPRPAHLRIGTGPPWTWRFSVIRC